MRLMALVVVVMNHLDDNATGSSEVSILRTMKLMALVVVVVNHLAAKYGWIIRGVDP